MTHTAELIAVGTELLLGNIANTDAQFLSGELSALASTCSITRWSGTIPSGCAPRWRLPGGAADIIITTGGLGPTCDDLTKTVLAETFGRRLVFHEASAERIKSVFARSGREMTENNLQQAMLPEGCVIFENDWGTAPGCAFEEDGCQVLMLPGPPGECAAMFRHRALPYLQALSDGIIHSRTLRIFGMGESAVEALLRDK
jgi:nicotinamide-nucleotide amidase